MRVWTCVIAEDVSPTALGMSQLLRPEIDVIAVVDDFSSLLKAVSTHRPDVVLLDPGLPDVCRLDAAELFRKQAAGTPFVVWSATYDLLFGIWCVAAGASAALSKTTSDLQIRSILARAATAAPVLSPDQAQWIVDRFEASERRLSRAEIAALTAVAEGATALDPEEIEVIRGVLRSQLQGLWLSPRHRRLVTALALYRTRDHAARWLDVKTTTFDSYVNETRPRLFPIRPTAVDGEHDRVAYWAMEAHASCMLSREEHIAYQADEAAEGKKKPADEG